MAKPLIGITAGHMLAPAERNRRQDVSMGAGRNHVAAVIRSGGAAVLLPPVADRQAIRVMMEAVDGLLLTGGGDVCSLEFGEELHPSIQFVDPPRDRMEIEAVKFAARHNVPILAICRGIQVLNIALGGGLIQDIFAEFEDPVRHWNKDLTASLTHTIEIVPGSLMATLAGRERIAVNSFHHQAVGQVAKGLRVTARSLDGVIEAIEAEDGSPILGVEFHPEDLTDEHPEFLAYFDWLVKEARRCRRTQRLPS